MGRLIAGDLQQHEATIERGLQTMGQVAHALRTIRDDRLFEEAGYTSWATYLERRWQRTDRWARLIVEGDAVVSQVAEHLPADVPPPTRLADAQALAGLPPEQAADIWEEAVEEAGPTPPKRVVQEKRAAKTAAAAQAPATTVAPEQVAVVRDGLKRALPGDIAATFVEAAEFKSVLEMVGQMEAAIVGLAEKQCGRAINLAELRRVLAELGRGLTMAKPHTECAKCRRRINRDCLVCHGRGWVTKTVYKASRCEGDDKWLLGN